MGETIDEEFQRLEKAIGTIRAKLSIKQKIEFYGLWCVATRGKCTIPAPSRANLLAYGKYRAWKNSEHLSSQEAKKRFVEKARPIVAKKAKL